MPPPRSGTSEVSQTRERLFGQAILAGPVEGLGESKSSNASVVAGKAPRWRSAGANSVTRW